MPWVISFGLCCHSGNIYENLTGAGESNEKQAGGLSGKHYKYKNSFIDSCLQGEKLDSVRRRLPVNYRMNAVGGNWWPER
jgi:hypothetical protein